MASLALAAAQNPHIQPHPMLMAVGSAASLGFTTKDYARLGVPLSLPAFLSSLLRIPLLWPFS